MTPMEIALLIVGVVIFVISFFLPGGNNKKSKKELEIERAEIQRLIEQEVDTMKLSVGEATTETVDNAVYKAERSLEKVSNEKIMAVNEYSQTILEEINKNHQEVMFLYDMLKDKHTDLTNEVRRADATAREIESLSNNALVAQRGLQQEINAISVTQKGLTDKQRAIFDALPNDNAKATTDNLQPLPVQVVSPQESVVINPVMEPIVNQMAEKKTEVVDMLSGAKFASGDEAGAAPTVSKAVEPVNNNQRILSLHQQGMSTVDIARELKLGVGEVKLVIDLFK